MDAAVVAHGAAKRRKLSAPEALEKDRAQRPSIDHGEVAKHFLAVLDPRRRFVPTLPEDADDRREMIFVNMQIAPQLKLFAYGEGVFFADLEGRLIATNVMRGVDLPAEFDEKGFVPPCFCYCAICRVTLNYWEELPQHLAPGQTPHAERRRRLEEAARAAAHLYAEQSLPGARNYMVVSASKRSFQCAACNLDGPWYEAAEHHSSKGHTDRIRLGRQVALTERHAAGAGGKPPSGSQSAKTSRAS
mmetsp:Transcript_156534/g.276465  ORF Transcript_156534/g.276465 Transcript_156534/m.276465 type:complete len:246 (-) Transcript_156534:13-750(-)